MICCHAVFNATAFCLHAHRDRGSRPRPCSKQKPTEGTGAGARQLTTRRGCHRISPGHRAARASWASEGGALLLVNAAAHRTTCCASATWHLPCSSRRAGEQLSAQGRAGLPIRTRTARQLAYASAKHRCNRHTHAEDRTGEKRISFITVLVD